jgi:hypothetical protein
MTLTPTICSKQTKGTLRLTTATQILLTNERENKAFAPT